MTAPRRRRHPLRAIFGRLNRRRKMSTLTLLLVVGMYGTIAVYPFYHHISALILAPAICFGAYFTLNALTQEPSSPNMMDSTTMDGAYPRHKFAFIIGYNMHRIFGSKRSWRTRLLIFLFPATITILAWRHELDSVGAIHTSVVHIVHLAHSIAAWFHEAYIAIRDEVVRNI